LLRGAAVLASLWVGELCVVRDSALSRDAAPAAAAKHKRRVDPIGPSAVPRTYDHQGSYLMKRIATALAFALALSTVAPSAFAEEAFRAPEAQTFTQQDLQQYGLSASDAAQVAAYQEQGYNVVVMSPEEAQQYQAGITNTQWLLIGLLVVVVAVAVS
jgi:hypothetical protein